MTLARRKPVDRSAAGVMRQLTPFTVMLTVNLEPIYGIALAWFILDDHKELTTGFYVGGLIILGAVFTYPILRKRYNRKAVKE